MSAEAFRFTWYDRDTHEPLPGYRINGSLRGFAWISPEDAYEVCCALADLVDEDTGVADDNDNAATAASN